MGRASPLAASFDLISFRSTFSNKFCTVLHAPYAQGRYIPFNNIMPKQTLLIGNDINKISNDYGWEDLIDNLIEFIGADGEITYDDNKPFPLLYEEIYVEAEKNRQKDEASIKKFISKDVSHISVNKIHQRIINSDFDT